MESNQIEIHLYLNKSNTISQTLNGFHLIIDCLISQNSSEVRKSMTWKCMQNWVKPNLKLNTKVKMKETQTKQLNWVINAKH